MSNQYGYIPIDQVANLQQTYSVANPQSWTFEKEGIEYGGVEEMEFGQAQKDEIIALGGQWFLNASEFFSWLNN